MSKRKVRQEPKVKTVEAITDNHKIYMDSIENNLVTICTGPAGSGKSYISSGIYARFLHNGEYDKIVITRPLICTGKDVGSLPGGVGEKISPYLRPMEENLKGFLGQSYYGLYLNEGRIRYEPLELMRGMTFDRTLMLLDEAQNCTYEQILMFITRVGKDSKVVINGDIKQNDLKGKSGMESIINKLSKVQIEGLQICHLTNEDIQRNGIIGKILEALGE
jgi:phosphate starvation-inducible PhoH-like protein